MDHIIEVNNLSKKYRIGHQKKERYSTLRDDLIDAFKKPIRWIRGERSTSEDVWALKDINLSVERGEILGLIGPNGAGKTTLLKILTKITPPSEGKAVIRGTVGSLLEVGTGFHPELTGRENIFLNGAILGMTKKEITKKFDEIVEFAGIGKFLDTPLKRYSSGMNVRLAFSVAAHLEPDILLVDEVLAVGDAAFQRKSLGKMEEITKTGNRTIIFVSHNMGAIQHLCKKCVLLESGRVKMIGDTSDVVKKHLDDSAGDSEIAFELTEERRSRTNGDIRFIKSVIQDENGNNIKNVYSGQNIKILLFYKGREDADLKNVRVNLNIDTPFGERVTSFYNHVVNSEFKQIPRNGHFIIDIPNFPLAPGTYPFTCYAMVSNSTSDWVTNAGHIEVANDKFFPSQDPMPEGQAIFYVKHSWSVEEDRQ